jgi:hypothetical protein
MYVLRTAKQFTYLSWFTSYSNWYFKNTHPRYNN